jgi:ERCC4-type nuclease
MASKQRQQQNKHPSIGELTNPNIIKCLEELAEDANKRKQDKLAFTYKKALRSVHKYPLPLLNGKECMILVGIGETLSAKIDGWLKKRGFYKESVPDNSPATSSSSQQTTNKKGKQKKQKTRQYTPKFKSAAWALLIALYRHYKSKESPDQPDPTKSELISLSSHLSDTPMLPASTGGGSNSQTRKNFSYCGWSCMKSTLLEKKLVSKRRGRPQRFFLTDTGLKLARKLHIGAIEMLNEDQNDWSDVTSDEEEEEEDTQSQQQSSDSDDVTTTNSRAKQKRKQPAQQKAKSVAEKQTNDSDSDVEILEISDSEGEEENHNTPLPTNPTTSTQPVAPPIRRTNTSTVTTPNPIQPTGMQLNYLNAMFQPVKSKDQAQVHIHDALGLVFLTELLIDTSIIEFDENDLEATIIKANDKEQKAYIDRELMKTRSTRSSRNVTPTTNFQVLIWMSDEACSNSSDNLMKELFENPRSLKAFKNKQQQQQQQEQEKQMTQKNAAKEKRKKKTSSSEQSQTQPSKKKGHSATDKTDDISSKKQSKTSTIATTVTAANDQNKGTKRKRLVSNEQHNQDNAEDEEETTDRISFLDYIGKENTTSSSPTKRQRHNKFSDTHDIVLVVDQRERLSNDRNYIVERLQQVGIPVESHQLGLGDFVWVARSKDGEDEHILNYIIERKAIDDLAGSIIDGRYKEQRFRLRQLIQGQQSVGIISTLNVIYLIEGDYARQNRLPVKNLQSALVRLQISDQFMVKHTPSISQSIDYLKTMTNVLTQLLDSNGLDNCKMVLEEDGEKFEPNLKQYNLYAAKSGSHQRNMTPQDIFARQLSCLSGISPQIAETIVVKYASDAKTLIEKLGSRKNKNAADLANISIPVARFRGVSSRRVGPALAKSLKSYYCADNNNAAAAD